MRPMCHATRGGGFPAVGHGIEVAVAQGGAPVGDRHVDVNVIERPLTWRSFTTWESRCCCFRTSFGLEESDELETIHREPAGSTPVR